MVESRLPKPLVAGSIPVSRSRHLGIIFPLEDKSRCSDSAFRLSHREAAGVTDKLSASGVKVWWVYRETLLRPSFTYLESRSQK